MDLTITSQSTNDYLLITTKGNLKTQEELIKQSEMIYEEFLKYDKKKILINEIETTFPTGLFNYYNLVNHYITEMPADLKSLKVAVVISKAFEKVAEFWEMVCTNRGFQYRSFGKIEDAHNWLIE